MAGFKIDISKAYDRLEWDFIRNMMVKFGFSELWIARTMKLITSVSYSFIRNGDVFGDITPHRGVRKGDPISPYIYIMCAEGLSSIIRRNEEVGVLHGCTVARGAPMISHLLFADDCYFFFRANKTEANAMKRILDRYEHISG
ncbi:secreted RxLR effector protein 78-like [Apium graveolens]|uniref:secreted RxLR effector protein 78-like n=1 Tax=Apium graveolens TaxID=4045 RepID=UPI003D7BA9B0